MRKFLIFGLVAAATVFMTSDALLATKGNSKSKSTQKACITFEYKIPDDDEAPQAENEGPPALAVLVRPDGEGPPKYYGDLKEAVIVEAGGEYEVCDLKPGKYCVWLGYAESLGQIPDGNDKVELPGPEDPEYGKYVIAEECYTLAAGENLEVCIGPIRGLYFQGDPEPGEPKVPSVE